MTTANDLITGALQIIGVYDPGTPLTSSDSTTALAVLNDMMDSWSNENLACYATQEISFVFVPGQQTYTIGAGGNVNVARPLNIIDKPGSVYVQDPNGNNYPVRVLTRDLWNSLGNRSPSVVTSNFPDSVFYDNQFPLGILKFNPTPSAPNTCFVDTYLQLTDFAALVTAVSLPPGYNRAIKYNLAMELRPYYTQDPLDPGVLQSARESKAAIKRMNARKLVSMVDNAIQSRAGPGYNIYTNQTGSNAGAPI